MLFADIALAKRLERAEGFACLTYADARKRLYPDCLSEWKECGGAYLVFDGVGSPVTQSFGLGIYQDLTPAILDEAERFFQDRGAAVHHEVSPLAGVEALRLLCSRGYLPIEISSVVYRTVSIEHESNRSSENIRVRIVGPEEAQLWANVGAEGWSDEVPDLVDFLKELGTVQAHRSNGISFLAEIDGVPAAAGSLVIHEGVAMFSGSATIPSMRKRGLQAALLQSRMRYASEHGCDLAMMVAMAGSGSQRNAERKGFRIAYTRTKWELSSPTK
jgi:GNAT superfamily N-acetyltransferase